MASVLIICGGLGTRLKGLHPEVPKPLIQVNGRPFIEWIVLAFVARGFRDFVFATGHLSEKVEAWVDRLNYENCTFQIAREIRPMGTGGAIINALSYCTDEIVITNGDSLLLFDFMELVNRLDENDMVIAARSVSDCSRYGKLELTEKGLLKRFSEKQPGLGLINGGIYFVKKKLFDGFKRDTPMSMETLIMPRLIETGAKILAYDVGNAPFIDIGLPETLETAEDFIFSNEDCWNIR